MQTKRFSTMNRKNKFQTEDVFRKSTEALLCYDGMCNPFMEETKELLTLDTKCVARTSVANLVAKHHEKGKHFFEEFQERIANSVIH